MPRQWPQGLEGTRGKILAQLCEAGATAVELGRRLGISSNATRMHLRVLDEHGLVAYHVVRRGVGKPTHVYELSPDASRLLSRAYVPVLHEVLGIWEREKDAAELLRGLQAAGRALATVKPVPAGPLSRRVSSAAAAFEEMGAIVRVDRHDSAWTIHGQCCPLGSLTSQHPGLCKMMESMVAVLAGGIVRERCQRGPRPHCVFEIRSGGDGKGTGRARRA